MAVRLALCNFAAQKVFAMEKVALLGMMPAELKALVEEEGLPAFAGKQLAQWVYQKGVGDIQSMSNISVAGRLKLGERYEVGLMAPIAERHSVDGTVKYLFPTRYGGRVETVFIPEDGRGTVCVSCQVGCKMGCHFCMTGRQGFQGQLTTTDILNQIYSLPERDQLTNIVFMGQGEPLDNFDAVLRATQLLMAPEGWAWSPRRMTISTVGLKKGLKRLLDESPCHVAISLHNPFHEERAAMIPAERSYAFSEMLELLRQYDWSGQRRLSFEYIVFSGQNDTTRHSRELVKQLGQLRCRVNLIRWHALPGDSQFAKSDQTRMVTMRDYLTHHGVRCTIRASRGQDIEAACGLLNTDPSRPSL